VNELLEFVARELVDHPDDVRVTQQEDDRGIAFQLRVHPEDMGKVIGKGGRTARAIRTVMRAAGARSGLGTLVEIVE
jgi:uncharacterized protein